MKVPVSKRGLDMPSSPIRRLAGASREAERRGTFVYKLNIGQPDIPTPPEAFEALTRIDRKVLEYSPSDGLESLRVKLAEYYKNCGLDIKPEEIIVTSGGSEAVLYGFLACLDPGDELIIPEPAYANYTAFALTAGVKIVPVKTTIETGFGLPPVEEFERLITPRTKGILICNPNNPTGYVYTREEMEAISDIAARHNLFLFADEVYREFCYSDRPFVSAMSMEKVWESAVLLDSVSKRYNECGIRIGCIVTRDPELRASLMKYCQARLSPPLLGQLVAEASIDVKPEYIEGVRNEYMARRDFLVERINRIPGCYTPLPEGAFYTIVALPVEDADDFCKWCLDEFSYEGQTVFMAPASGFYFDQSLGRNQVRIAYVHEIPYLSKACDVLEKALEAYKNK